MLSVDLSNERGRFLQDNRAAKVDCTQAFDPAARATKPIGLSARGVPQRTFKYGILDGKIYTVPQTRNWCTKAQDVKVNQHGLQRFNLPP